MTTYAIKAFDRRTRKLRIGDERLLEAAQRVLEGRAYADLGGGLYKERIPRDGEGRSGGFRAVLCLRNDDIVISFTVFAKREKDNLDGQEFKAAQKLAAAYKSMGEDELMTALGNGAIREIKHGDPDATTQATEKS